MRELAQARLQRWVVLPQRYFHANQLGTFALFARRCLCHGRSLNLELEQVRRTLMRRHTFCPPNIVAIRAYAAVSAANELSPTGQGIIFQIPLAYCEMVRSLENFPELPTLIIAARFHAVGFR